MEYPYHSIQAYMRRQSNEMLEMTLEDFRLSPESDYTRFMIAEIQAVFQERGYQPEQGFAEWEER